MNADRSIVALVAAADGVVVAVVALVLLFGIARSPSLPTLADDPTRAPNASVAWLAPNGDVNCLMVAHPDGTSRELRCAWDGGEVRAWDEEGIALWAFGSRSSTRRPPRSSSAARSATPKRSLSPVRSAVSRRHDGTVTVVRGDTGEVVWEVDAPEGYRVHDGALSPGGDLLAMFDSADRLLLVPTDDSAEPRIWFEEATTWWTPVWEGTSVDDEVDSG